MFQRPTAVIIDLESLAHNFREVSRLAGCKTPVAPVIKSDAYGHGMIEIARKLAEIGAERLAVSLTEEGCELREAGIDLPILILGGSYPGQAREIVEQNLTPVISTPSMAKSLHEAAQSRKQKIRVHVKVDTGLGRLGILIEEVFPFLNFLKEMPFLMVDGICSTFSSVADIEFARKQLETFEKIGQEAIQLCGKPLLLHIAHSGGLLLGLTRPGWLVRPGILLYGYTRGMKPDGVRLEPVLTWRTEVYKVQKYPVGFPIGYGGAYKTKEGSRIALLPVGYSDGLFRSYAGKGGVLIRGSRAPLVGRFSMDWVMAEVGDLPEVRPGDEAVFIGEQGRERIDAEEMAEKAGTIVDEVLVSIAKRAARSYKNHQSG
jgi:alanine racemase